MPLCPQIPLLTSGTSSPKSLNISVTPAGMATDQNKWTIHRYVNMELLRIRWWVIARGNDENLTFRKELQMTDWNISQKRWKAELPFQNNTTKRHTSPVGPACIHDDQLLYWKWEQLLATSSVGRTLREYWRRGQFGSSVPLFTAVWDSVLATRGLNLHVCHGISISMVSNHTKLQT